MSTPLSILQSQTIDSSENVNLASISLASAVLIEQDASTPAGDPVVVTLNGLSINTASTYTVQNGATLDIASAASVAAVTSVNIGTSGTLELGKALPLNVGFPITITGPNATLILTQSGANTSSGLIGFTASDTIDFRGVAAATSVSYANSTLELLNGTTMVASTTVTGSFGTGTLSFAADGSGGISVGDNVSTVSNRLSGASSSYTIAVSGSAQDTVQDSVSGRDGSNTILNGQTVGFSDGVGIIDPSGSAENLAHLYQAVLGRAPDLGGLENLTSEINQGSLSASADGDVFVNSAEFNAKYGTLTNTQFVGVLAQNIGATADTATDQAAIAALNGGTSRGTIAMQFAESSTNILNTVSYTGDASYGEFYRLYEATLDRAPDAGGLQHFLGEIQSGTSLQTIANEFLSSQEYANDFGALSNSAFVTQLYQNGLSRAPDAGGLQTWVNQLAGGASRATVALGISDSLESRVHNASGSHDGWVFIGK